MSTTEPGLNGQDQTHRGRLALPLAPLPAETRPKRRLNLILQPLADVAAFTEGDLLEVKQFKRLSDVFTPHLPGTVQCQGFVFKPAGPTTPGSRFSRATCSATPGWRRRPSRSRSPRRSTGPVGAWP